METRQHASFQCSRAGGQASQTGPWYESAACILRVQGPVNEDGYIKGSVHACDPSRSHLAVNRSVPLGSRVSHLWSPGFPYKVHTVSLRDQNDSQCHQCHLDTMSQDIFCYVTSPVEETEVVGDSPFLSARQLGQP